MTTPKVVSKRNHFTPADEFVELEMDFLPEQLKHENIRPWLLRYTESVIKQVAWNFATAAEKGIHQAAELLCDPEYYETKKQRRKKDMERMKEQQAQQEWEQAERLHLPTKEQIEQQIKSVTNEIAYHRARLEEYENKLERLKNIEPKNIRLVPKGVQ